MARGARAAARSDRRRRRSGRAPNASSPCSSGAPTLRETVPFQPPLRSALASDERDPRRRARAISPAPSSASVACASLKSEWPALPASSRQPASERRASDRRRRRRAGRSRHSSDAASTPLQRDLDVGARRGTRRRAQRGAMSSVSSANSASCQPRWPAKPFGLSRAGPARAPHAAQLVQPARAFVVAALHLHHVRDRVDRPRHARVAGERAPAGRLGLRRRARHSSRPNACSAEHVGMERVVAGPGRRQPRATRSRRLRRVAAVEVEQMRPLQGERVARMRAAGSRSRPRRRRASRRRRGAAARRGGRARARRRAGMRIRPRPSSAAASPTSAGSVRLSRKPAFIRRGRRHAGSAAIAASRSSIGVP